MSKNGKHSGPTPGERDPGAMRFEQFFSHGHLNTIPTDPLAPINFERLTIVGGQEIIGVTYSPSGHGNAIKYYKRGNNCDVTLVSYDPVEGIPKPNDVVSQQILNDQSPFPAFLEDFEKFLSHPKVTVDYLNVMLHGDVTQQFVDSMSKKLRSPIPVRHLELDIKCPLHHVKLLKFMDPMKLKKLQISYFGETENVEMKISNLANLPIWRNLEEVFIKLFVATDGFPDLQNLEKVLMSFSEVDVKEVVGIIQDFQKSSKAKEFSFYFTQVVNSDKLFDLLNLQYEESISGLKIASFDLPDTENGGVWIMLDAKDKRILLKKKETGKKSDSRRFFGF